MAKQHYPPTDEELFQDAVMGKPCIWEVKVSDGIIQYFESKYEAEFYAKDTAAAGFSVRTSPIPVPQTPKDFVMFMEQQFETHRKLILAARDLAPV